MSEKNIELWDIKLFVEKLIDNNEIQPPIETSKIIPFSFQDIKYEIKEFVFFNEGKRLIKFQYLITDGLWLMSENSIASFFKSFKFKKTDVDYTEFIKQVKIPADIWNYMHLFYKY